MNTPSPSSPEPPPAPPATEAPPATDVVLTPALWGPSSLLGLILLALTFLPMASCGLTISNNNNQSGQRHVIIPAQLAWETIAQRKGQRPRRLSERLYHVLANLPALFWFTWAYWTALPAITPLLLLFRRPASPRSRRLVTGLWRALTLALAVACAVTTYNLHTARGYVMAMIAATAVALWLLSSPAIAWTRDKMRRPYFHPIPAALVALGMLCLLAATHLVWYGGALLIGGMLAAAVNVSMGVVALASARQARKNCHRLPQFTIPHMLFAALIAACYMWLYLARL